MEKGTLLAIRGRIEYHGYILGGMFMNTAAKEIHNKYHRHKFRLPLWGVMLIMLMLTIIVSAWVAVNAANERIDAIIDNMPEYTEAGEAPKWFKDWLKREGLE